MQFEVKKAREPYYLQTYYSSFSAAILSVSVVHLSYGQKKIFITVGSGTASTVHSKRTLSPSQHRTSFNCRLKIGNVSIFL